MAHGCGVTRMDVSFDLSSLATALTNQHRHEEAVDDAVSGPIPNG
jgi:hypothetical protein